MSGNNRTFFTLTVNFLIVYFYLLESRYLFGDEVLIHFALHFLKSGGDRGQLGRPHRLVKDLLAVPECGQTRDQALTASGGSSEALIYFSLSVT